MASDVNDKEWDELHRLEMKVVRLRQRLELKEDRKKAKAGNCPRCHNDYWRRDYHGGLDPCRCCNPDAARRPRWGKSWHPGMEVDEEI